MALDFLRQSADRRIRARRCPDPNVGVTRRSRHSYRRARAGDLLGGALPDRLRDPARQRAGLDKRPDPRFAHRRDGSSTRLRHRRAPAERPMLDITLFQQRSWVCRSPRSASPPGCSRCSHLSIYLRMRAIHHLVRAFFLPLQLSSASFRGSAWLLCAISSADQSIGLALVTGSWRSPRLDAGALDPAPGSSSQASGSASNPRSRPPRCASSFRCLRMASGISSTF